MTQITMDVVDARTCGLSDEAWNSMRDMAYGSGYARPEVGFSFMVARDYIEGHLKDCENDNAEHPDWYKKYGKMYEEIKALYATLTTPMVFFCANSDERFLNE